MAPTPGYEVDTQELHETVEMDPWIQFQVPAKC